jgi:AcrR family transcriptional regulator
MPRAGLTPDAVVAAAVDILDTDGSGAVSLAAVATRLGVKAPSLYNHVAGLDDLRRRVAIAGIDRLADVMRTAVMGRSGAVALTSLASAYRTFGTSHPGLYLMTQEAHPEDPEYALASDRAVAPALAVLESYGLAGDGAIHAARALRSALHGFVVLENQGGFGLDLDIDESFRRLVAMLEASLSRQGGGPPAEPD